jgi:AcrR family transcriptional regulator
MRATAQREDIQDLILDAADRLLGRYGYGKMTIDDLAREVGIGKGTIYLHFGSKEEIALAHVDRIVGAVVDRLRSIAVTKASAAERITTMLVARVMMRFDAVKHYRESLAEKLAAIRPALDARRVHHFASEAAALAEVVRDGQRARELRRGDAERVARSLVAATNSFLPYSLSTRQLGRRSDVEEAVADVAGLLVDGLKHTTA